MGEGKNEEMFCKFLKNLFTTEGLSLTIKNSKGCSVHVILDK
jgi:hypothetical protein